MIISHKYKTIFFHCRKTGGSAIKLNLYPHLGPHDLVVGGITEVVEQGYKLNRKAKEELIRPTSAAVYTASRLRGMTHAQASNFTIKRRYKNVAVLPEHATASEIRDAYPREFETYYKFSFVRNPYTQVVSDYYWRRKNTGADVSFSEYIDMLEGNSSDPFVHRGKVKNYEILSIDGQVSCDFVGKFENLSADFSYVTKVLGVDCTLRKVAKSGTRSKKSYQTLYTSRERDKVATIFKDELEEFGYTWPYPEIR
jgi:hypothetical protein